MCMFTVNQTVRCINPENPRVKAESGGGSGWILGHLFRITRISDGTNDFDVPILWGGKGGGGVYEDWVESEDGWDGKINYKEG